MVMIRILHIVSSLKLGSGVMSVLMNYHRKIDTSKLQFDYLSLKKADNTFEDEIKELGGKIFYLPASSPLEIYRKEADSFFSIHENEYSIIHCHPIFCGGVFAKSAKKHGIRHVIQHSHTASYGHNTVSKLRNFLFVLLFKSEITDFMACSEVAKKVFFWVKSEKIFLMRNAVPIEKYQFTAEGRDRIRRETGIGLNEKLFGHVGRFSKEKNHVFLLKIFAELKKNNNNAKLMLVGDGSEMDLIKDIVRKMGLESSVIFTGRQQNIADYMSAMDVFIFPSLFEGLGLVLLEAQINGLPCIASDTVPKEVTVSDGIIYKSLKEEVSSWVKSTEQLKRKDNIELYIENYRIEHMVKNLQTYYESLV